ncbi:recombinase family protein [Thermoactinomyces mirandus]|uniref:Recombinase family protein n=1 Tax=Thermoactinomyces mirandus TaxID=2756294 RepID=A0A7W1XRP5_9BACL|nr:recombinase family protein [Thermoactinomyces mirandus]MBA4601871.1 recombinase family protein [Thermoactinomyces mirandus]
MIGDKQVFNQHGWHSSFPQHSKIGAFLIPVTNIVLLKVTRDFSKKPPYGYLRDENLKLYPDPNTSWVVKRIFERIAEGAGRVLVARELDEMGIKPPTNKYWAPSTISSFIKNEVYLGHIIWGKLQYKKRNGKYKRKKVPPDQWIRHENAHEPLVSEDLFEQVNLAHTGRWRTPTVKNKELANPLAGILYCELCNHAMVQLPKIDRRNHIRCLQTSCKGIQRGAVLELVEKRVLEGLEQIIQTFEASDEEMNKQNHISLLPYKREQLIQKEAELQDLFEQRNNLHEFLEKKVYTIEVFMERQQIVGDKIKKCQEAIHKIKQEIEMEEEKEKRRNEYVPKIKNVLEAYRETEDIEKKNRLLKSVLEKATFLRKKNGSESTSLLFSFIHEFKRRRDSHLSLYSCFPKKCFNASYTCPFSRMTK